MRRSGTGSLLIAIYLFCIPAIAMDRENCSNTSHDEFKAGESVVVNLVSSDPQCYTGIKLKTGGYYRFSIVEVSHDWADGSVQYHHKTGTKLDERGWNASWLSFWRKPIVLANTLKRCYAAQWFELVGYTEGSGSLPHVRIGHGIQDNRVLSYKGDDDRELILYANDWIRMYYNNHGRMRIKIENMGSSDGGFKSFLACS